MLKGVENIAIKLVGTIDFPSRSNNLLYSTHSRDTILYPDPDANAYHIKDLFQMAQVNATVIKEIGGVFELIMNWNCELDDVKCKPNLEVKFINQTSSLNPMKSPLGYFVEKSLSYDEKRDYILSVGLKFNLISKGFAKSFNFFNLLIQVYIIPYTNINKS